jgi:AraC family transcriptional regulator of adaptative response / DNA-3-methyladenine glycosylase II
VESQRYARTVSVDGTAGVIEVRHDRAGFALRARLELARPAPRAAIAGRLRRLFDLGADPAAIGSWLRRDPRLARRLRLRPGIRVPGAWDGFELAVRAVLGQQVRVAAATRLAGRLVELHGRRLPGGGVGPGLTHLFPEPAELLRVSAARLGLPRRRAETLARLARGVAAGELRLDAAADLDAAVAALEAVPGIGPWTAHYVAMRALREPDAFPAGDLGLRRALGRPGRPAAAARVAAQAEAWRPWRAYAAMLLWSVPR